MADDFQIDDREVVAALLRLAKEVPDIALRELRVEGEAIRTRSMRLTPVKTGTLRDSHIVKGKQTPTGPEVTIGVGAEAESYAIHVHERTDLRHKPPTRDHFLETALTEAGQGMARRLGEKIAAGMREQT